MKKRLLTPHEDGALEAYPEVKLPVSTPRLQALLTSNSIEELSVWGSGPLGRISLLPDLPENTQLTLYPNRFYLAWEKGYLRMTALNRIPAILLEHSRGLLSAPRLFPHPRVLPGLSGRTFQRALAEGLVIHLPQGVLGAASPGACARSCRLLIDPQAEWTVIAAGSDYEEVEEALRTVFSAKEQLVLEAEREKTWLGTRLRVTDPVLGSMFIHSLHAALSSRKKERDGRFAGLSAGYGYGMPARTYYRDAYWTAQSLYAFKPGWARDQIMLLARGIHNNGEGPSGVIISSPAGDRYWQALKAADPQLAQDHPLPGEWWSDHFDAPLFFILMVLEYVEWTGDSAILEARVRGASLWELVRRVINRYRAISDPSALPVKPAHDRDWADNVFRSGFVTYDIALYYGALVLAAKRAEKRGDSEGAAWKQLARKVKTALSNTLWIAERGYLAEYRRLDGFREEHFAIDTLTALRFKAVSRDQEEAVFKAAARLLETRNNRFQPYGDWGVMCAYPGYRERKSLRGKTLFPYRYHNGSDWPYWDGLYAQLLLEAGNADWHYPLTRWWTYGLSRGWPEPVEYFSPPWGRGSPLQSWSSMPAAAMILGGFGLSSGENFRVPPWGESELNGVQIQGRCISIRVRNNSLNVIRE